MTNKALNIIGLTQGQNIDLLVQLLDTIREKKSMEIGRVGALVSFANHFIESNVETKNEFNIEFIKEWEIFDRARHHSVSQDDLATLQDVFSDGAIWRSIIGDRRLIYGKRSKNFEDYRVHYSEAFLYALATVFTAEFTTLLDRIKPDVVVGFTAVTFGELLALNICRQRGIPTLQLHSSRIGNYFAFHNELTGTSSHVTRLMENSNSLSQNSLQEAQNVIEQIRLKGLIYEGVNLKIRNGRPFQPMATLRSLPGAMVQEFRRYTNPVTRRDHHDPGTLAPWFYNHIRQPMRARSVNAFLAQSSRQLTVDQLAKIGDFAFYPLHSEPEVAIQVLAPPYHKNQIELIRNIAISLPFGMKLVVKEHPRSFGLRPIAFYRSLLQIPNLYFVPMQADSLDVSRQSSLVCVISSTIGLEAICIGKPVLMLGHPKYEAVPSGMAALCENMFELPHVISNLLRAYTYDKQSLTIFIAALIEGSVPIDLYSVMLGKPDRFSAGREGLNRAQKIHEDFDKLAEYTVSRIREELALKSEHPVV